MQTEVKIPNFSKMVGNLKGLNKDIDKAIGRTIADCKTRGPAQVTKAVTAVYGIKSGEVTATGKAAKGGAKTVGSIKVSGVTVDSVQLIYRGRVLTPTHFSMTPKKRPTKQQDSKDKVPGSFIGDGFKVAMVRQPKPYSINVEILKGRRRALGSRVFIAPSGAAGTTEIPFRRTSEKRLPIEAIHTVSIPQMIGNETVKADIQTRMEELLATRLKHNTERIASKK